METNRLEAFSDGVFAIAITLLVLDLRVPHQADLAAAHRPLGRALLLLWPNYAGYVVSFLVIGIIWVNHHAMFKSIARADRMLLFLNLLLLLFVALIPFPTALLAEYIRRPESHLAAAVYSGVMFGMSVTFSAVWRWASRREHLLDPSVPVAGARSTVRRFSLGMVAYLTLIGVAFISAPLTLALHAALAINYVFNQLPIPDSTL